MTSDLSFLLGAAGAAAAAVATSLLLRSVRPHARTDGNGAIVEYGVPMKLFVVVAWLLTLSVAIAAAREGTETVLAWSVTGGYSILVLALHLEFFVSGFATMCTASRRRHHGGRVGVFRGRHSLI
jgi:hypothetical protein